MSIGRGCTVEIPVFGAQNQHFFTQKHAHLISFPVKITLAWFLKLFGIIIIPVHSHSQLFIGPILSTYAKQVKNRAVFAKCPSVGGVSIDCCTDSGGNDTQKYFK